MGEKINAQDHTLQVKRAHVLLELGKDGNAVEAVLARWTDASPTASLRPLEIPF
jgi:hypothetical protein